MKNDALTTIAILKQEVNQFVTEREWDQFHSPKNLSMAISIEAAELMDEFRFMSCEESKQKVVENKEKVAQEIADVLIACLSFSNLYDIDLSNAVMQKIAVNRAKYPLEQSRGSNKKYTHYAQK